MGGPAAQRQVGVLRRTLGNFLENTERGTGKAKDTTCSWGSGSRGPEIGHGLEIATPREYHLSGPPLKQSLDSPTHMEASSSG